ncbi:uncharacterized protein PRCAT00002730001 [Priceomyces carsonii]|uniref:uncharacterized protein n=1 Tax=Priceomyces carsonii TaxID=28549 RepID=UPI002EDA03CD|nr:unnamed protein product [Priceomyces carsonii]
MSSGETVAPVLSSYQDESHFNSFDKFKLKDKLRQHLGDVKNRDELVDRIIDYYSLNVLADYLKTESQKDGEKGFSRKFKTVTLQFPDSLISDSAIITNELQKRLELTLCNINNHEQKRCKEGSCCSRVDMEDFQSQRLWILADTSYSPCCIDEVAAEHVNGDLVVHFGDACLNPVDKISSAYVFGKPIMNIEKVVLLFKERYSDKNLKILLMADAPHTFHLRSIYGELRKEYPNLSYADLSLADNPKAVILGYEPFKADDTTPLLLNRFAVGSNKVESLTDVDLFHITFPEAPRLLQLTTKFKSLTIYDTIHKKISLGPFPSLMRRYRLLHLARSAGTIGLLVNTLSLANTKDLINAITKRIKESDKKHYIFVVGKPNVAKLANFENIDLWCVLGCDHQGIIIDDNQEYYKPIVTPYELFLALSEELEWTGQWVTDFRRVLEDFEAEQNKDKTHREEVDPDAPEFNPVTGQYVSTSRPLRALRHLEISNTTEDSKLLPKGSQALSSRPNGGAVMKNTVSTSASHLQGRHWTGLGSDFNEQEEDSSKGATLEEGTVGIARGYDYDIQSQRP